MCIPGFWYSIEELENALHTSSNGDYMLVDDMLLSIKGGRHYRFEVGRKDKELTGLCARAGKATGISAMGLNEIEKHNFVIYVSAATGSLEEAEHMAFAGAALLKAGGSGIEINTAGKAFEKSKWLNYIKTFHEADLYQMFVTEERDDSSGSVFSRGMHNLGLKDAIVSGEEPQTAHDLISVLGYHQVFGETGIEIGRGFQTDRYSPLYLIAEEAHQPYKGHSLFENPFGMLRLIKI